PVGAHALLRGERVLVEDAHVEDVALLDDDVVAAAALRRQAVDPDVRAGAAAGDGRSEREDGEEREDESAKAHVPAIIQAFFAIAIAHSSLVSPGRGSARPPPGPRRSIAPGRSSRGRTPP